MKEKLNVKWKVSPAPTGRYRSFEFRQFPSLYYKDGQIAASILCKDEYNPKTLNQRIHDILRVVIYNYSNSPITFIYLKDSFLTLSVAKEATISFLKQNPHYWVKDE